MLKIETVAREHAKMLAARLKVHYGLHLDMRRESQLHDELTRWLLGENPVAPAPETPKGHATVKYECGCEATAAKPAPACMRHGAAAIQPEPAAQDPVTKEQENPDAA